MPRLHCFAFLNNSCWCSRRVLIVLVIAFCMSNIIWRLGCSMLSILPKGVVLNPYILNPLSPRPPNPPEIERDREILVQLCLKSCIEESRRREENQPITGWCMTRQSDSFASISLWLKIVVLLWAAHNIHTGVPPLHWRHSSSAKFSKCWRWPTSSW